MDVRFYNGRLKEMCGVIEDVDQAGKFTFKSTTDN